jgi:hypothetical protein
MIKLKFQNQPVLLLDIQDTEVGHQYQQLVKYNYSKSMPIYRDTLKYTTEYMQELGQQARTVFGWSWDEHDVTSGMAPALHKNLEELLATGFDLVPAEHDNLVHELHYCLHLNQHGALSKRRSWLQIEWFNDSGFTLDRSFEFKHSLEFGEIKLQNPYVGHSPLQLYQEQDGINISQTCKFHNFVKPGINIAETTYPEFTDFDGLINFINQHDPEFVQRNGVDTILHYTGYPVIGQVKNLDDLQTVVNSGILEFESLEFDE